MTKRWELTPEILEKIGELAEQRYMEIDIAKAVGLGSSAWYNKKKEYPEIQEAINDAKLAKVDFAKGKLWKIIENEEHKGHLQAVMYFLNKYDTEQVKEGENASLPPTGFTWRIVTAEDVAKSRDGDE